MNDMPDISAILNMLNSTKSQQETTGKKEESTNVNSFFDDASMPDMETMMKIMKVVNTMKSGENNASANLLNSLKPFLRDSKKEKIDQYIKFIKLSNVISEINDLENKG